MFRLQRGLGIISFIIYTALVLAASVIAMQLTPAYWDNMAIQRIFTTIASDPTLQDASEANIRLAFARQAAIDDISILKADDIHIFQYNHQLQLSANYRTEKPIFGHLGFYIDFSPSSKPISQ